MRQGERGVLFGLLLIVSAAGTGSAQEVRLGELLPARTLVRTIVGDPHAARFSAGVIGTDLLATQGPERPPFEVPDAADAAFDVVAALSLGAVLPLVTVGAWETGGAMLVLEARVHARFRLEAETRDDMGQDWVVGGGIEARDGALSGRALITHRSSHLGDEFMVNTGAQRIEFGSEQFDVLGAWDATDAVRVYGGGSWIFRSYLDWDARFRDLGIEDRAAFRIGSDGEWRVGEPAGPMKAWAGIDVQLAERTGWDPGWSAAAGLGIDTGGRGSAGRTFRIMLVWYDGPSTMGEFFLTPERYYGLEINAIL